MKSVRLSAAARGVAWCGTVPGVLGVALLLVVALLAFNVGYFFTDGIAEEGDAAANALQIMHAKDGDELLGNYSRWRFHHPGPAFWYVYAAGEVWLHDGLGWTASPANAHSVAGLLWQVLFFVGGAVMVVRAGLGERSLAAGFALGLMVFTAVNVHETGAVLMSIWPPHALLGPLVGFVLAAAAAAAGSRGALVAMVFAGSVLVHGHVVMPLLVGPIGLVAGLAWWRAVEGKLSRRRAPLAGAAVIVGLALGPILWELWRNAPNNLDRILTHLGSHPEGTDWSRALAYPLSFFAPGNDPEVWLAPAGNGLGRLWLVAPWALVFGIGALAAQAVITLGDWRRANEPDDDAAQRFRRWWGTVLLLAWVLSAVWAWRQTGPLFQFNSFFQYGLVFLLYWSLTDRLLERLPTTGRQIAAGALAGGVALIVLTSSNAWRPQKRGVEAALFDEVVTAALTSDRVHELVFAQDDWQKAVQVALALVRSGNRFEVAPEWGFLFGERYVAASAFGRGRDTIQIARKEAVGMTRLADGVWAGPAALPTLDPSGLIWRFGAEGNARSYQWFGFSGAEPDRVWTDGKLARFAFRAPPLTQDRTLVIDCAAMANTTFRQAVRVWLDDTEIAQADLTSDRDEWRIAIPASVWNASSEKRLTFAMPGAHSPASRGNGNDYRELGICFYGMWLE